MSEEGQRVLLLRWKLGVLRSAIHLNYVECKDLNLGPPLPAGFSYQPHSNVSVAKEVRTTCQLLQYYPEVPISLKNELLGHDFL